MTGSVLNSDTDMRKQRTATGQNGVAPEGIVCGLPAAAAAPLREITALLAGCEPPEELGFQRLPSANGQAVLA